MELRCCCYFECSCFFCCGLLCPFTKKRGGRGRPVGVVFRGHHVFRPPRQSRAVKGEDDWNKIEHDFNTAPGRHSSTQARGVCMVNRKRGSTAGCRSCESADLLAYLEASLNRPAIFQVPARYSGGVEQFSAVGDNGERTDYDALRRDQPLGW